MTICYLNHDQSQTTGAGRFLNFLKNATRKLDPSASFEVLTSENILYPSKLKLLFALPAIRRIIKTCDIVHALDGWPYSVIAAIAAIGLKKKLIITAVGTGGIKPLYNFWQRPLLKWAYRRADRVTAISRYTRDEILKVIPDLKIEVINHGVDWQKFQSVVGRSSSVTSGQSLVAKPYLLSVGAWKKRKGLEYSIKAFQEIKKLEIEKFRNLKYVILSNPPEEIRKKYGQVNFVSNLSEDELIGLYKNAELFILLPQDDNKDTEGFGLAYLEAAAAGLPVIGAKDTSAEDAVLDGQNGFLVSGQDPQEAASKMEQILTDPVLKDKMSRASLEFAKKMTWEKAAQSYLEIYKNV